MSSTPGSAEILRPVSIQISEPEEYCFNNVNNIQSPTKYTHPQSFSLSFSFSFKDRFIDGQLIFFYSLCQSFVFIKYLL